MTPIVGMGHETPWDTMGHQKKHQKTGWEWIDGLEVSPFSERWSHLKDGPQCCSVDHPFRRFRCVGPKNLTQMLSCGMSPTFPNIWCSFNFTFQEIDHPNDDVVLFSEPSPKDITWPTFARTHGWQHVTTRVSRQKHHAFLVSSPDESYKSCYTWYQGSSGHSEDRFAPVGG